MKKTYLLGLFSLLCVLISSCTADPVVVQQTVSAVKAKIAIANILTAVSIKTQTHPTQKPPAESTVTPITTLLVPATIVIPAQTLTLYVMNPDGWVNVRSGPGTNFPVVGTVNDGERISALGAVSSGDWVLFLYPAGPNRTAWIYAPLTTYYYNNTTLPIIKDPPSTPVP